MKTSLLLLTGKKRRAVDDSVKPLVIVVLSMYALSVTLYITVVFVNIDKCIS